MATLYLASGSPRRRQFLLELGFDFRVLTSETAEIRDEDETPEPFARRLARDKANNASGAPKGGVVLAADTIVVVDAEVLGKPTDEDDFRRMMRLLSGREHVVMTGVAVRVVGGETRDLSVTTRVTFRSLTPQQIDWYWMTGEPKGKAGGYAIQGKGGAFIERIDGSHSNVIGLPLPETLELLEASGVQPPWLQPRVRR